MSKKSKKTYTVMIELKLLTDMQISADSMEEALAKAYELEMKDIVQFDGNYNDGEIEITGVYK